LKEQRKILIIGYGNPGRQDDGLGVLLADEISTWAKREKLGFVITDTDYQLNIEDAATVTDCDVVIFADASKEDIEDFNMTELHPSDKTDFSMHTVSPAYILHICENYMNHNPEAFLLHIKGYEWEFMSEMTSGARKNLSKALNYVKNFILNQLSINLTGNSNLLNNN